VQWIYADKIKKERKKEGIQSLFIGFSI
jgi:hypothetical protein